MAPLKKEKETPKRTKVKVSEEAPVAKEPVNEGRWQPHIDRLREQSFSSTDEVISAIAKEVTTAMGLGDDDEAHKFIRDTILTDPAMSHRLHSFVKTK